MATIIMESNKVIDAANAVINKIMAERDKRDEQTIVNAMGQKMFSFKRGFYKLNHAEAIVWINSQGFCSSWSFSMYAWGTLENAKKLLKLAQHGDPVTLNEDDIEVLF